MPKVPTDSLNDLLPAPSPSVADEVQNPLPTFLPKKKVSIDHLTPLKRPSSARARAVRADMVVQSVDFGSLSRNKSNHVAAKFERSAKVASPPPPRQALEASVTGSLLGQIKVRMDNKRRGRASRAGRQRKRRVKRRLRVASESQESYAMRQCSARSAR
jgi:hypothetical protein